MIYEAPKSQKESGRNYLHLLFSKILTNVFDSSTQWCKAVITGVFKY